MLTEECDTRPFLERRGIQVTETDLGERIQQLDDQPPSHIVGPAFQKTTQDVADLFHRVYGSDQDRADPVYLAQVMREHTRPLILRAEAGMTGANFVVAQTGAVVTVTNEGNADLSGNVPKLRICSVGIEKMVPGVEELAVFIRLLTRSATGERITQYTSHFAGPRADGEMHVVLVDNGRTQRLADERFWPSLKCIRCAACMNTCPVYRRSGGLQLRLHPHGADRHHHDAELRHPPPQRAALRLDAQRQLLERLPRPHHRPVYRRLGTARRRDRDPATSSPCWRSTWSCCSTPKTSSRTSTPPTATPASRTPRTRSCCRGRPGQPTSAA
jgi:hypothetical protein